LGPEQLAPLVWQSGTLPYPLPTHGEASGHSSKAWLKRRRKSKKFYRSPWKK